MFPFPRFASPDPPVRIANKDNDNVQRCHKNTKNRTRPVREMQTEKKCSESVRARIIIPSGEGDGASGWKWWIFSDATKYQQVSVGVVRVYWYETFVRHSVCRRKSTATRTHTVNMNRTQPNREVNGKHASDERATSDRFQFEPCYSYRLRVRAVKMNGKLFSMPITNLYSRHYTLIRPETSSGGGSGGTITTRKE